MACPGVRNCKISCGHRNIIETFYAARDAQELEVEAFSYGYVTETNDYYDRNERVTFKSFLSTAAGSLTERY